MRLDMQDLRLEKYQVVCATSLQRIFRAHHARVVARQRLRLVTRDYQYAAALRLQTAMRSKWARVSMQRVGMLHTETYRLRREAQLTRKIQATRMLQAMLRSYLARELVLLPELAMRQAQCALLLSRIYRGHIGRRLFERRCYEKEMEGALKIQGAYRLHLARLLLRRTVEQHRIASLLSLAQRQQRGAAIIQHAYFMHVCRLKLKDRAAQVMMCMMLRCMASVKYRSGLAASTVQAALRRHKSRRKLQVALAADSLRAHMRRMIMRNKCRRKLASRNLTAAALAALIRHNYASKLAADTISASVSALFARHRYAQQQSCALLLATVLKRSCARQHYRKQRACLRLQSVVRGHMDREWTRANSSDMKQHRYILACIVKLQATQRGHASRLAVGAVKELNVRIQAAVQAQAFCRQARASRAYGHLLVEQTRMIWATVLQRYWRGALARHHRKYLALLKIQKSAALQVQRVFRGHNGRVLMHERSDELECIHGAIILQTWLRGFMAQARVNAIRHRNACTTAAVSIQAGARGMASRTRARTLHALRRMEKSAIKIQARVRGIQGRQAAARRHEQVVSHREYRTQIAISIQSCYRQHLAKAAYVTAIEERADLEFVKGCCADILQLSVRCFNARNMVRKRKEACMLITALGRGFLSRRKTFKRRQVLEGQELYVAPHKLHPDRYRVPPEQDLKRPAPKSKVRRFRAEARVHERQPSPLPWHVRQRQAVVDFQSKPQIKAFFSDLQEREHAKASTATKTAQQKPKTNKTSTAKTASTSSMSNTAGVTSTKSTVKSVSPVNLLAEKQARPVSATVSRVSGSAAAMPRPATAMPGRLQPPSTSGTGRVPPRFQKVRQNKVGGIGDSGRTRPRARGSDSERNSDEEMPPMPASMATAPKISQPQAPPPAQLQPMPTQPPRALYNKDDISSDPPSDEQRRKKSKDKPKDKPTRATSPEKLAFKKAASTAGPKIEAAFKHCRLGKYHEVELALQEGVQVDSRFGPDNNTMLLACAQNGQKRIAKLLLRNGADMNAPNDKGDTAMHLCYKFNYKELGEYLKSKGADDTIQNAKGQTCYQAQAKK